ncbi:MAG: DNA-3-methyladenine glycosylase I [Actinomycetota bacterium]
MTKSVFQPGISWAVIEAKWEGFRAAFHGFDAERVADLSPKDVDRLVEDASIVRNRRKIEATVHNAETMLALEREHGSFRTYLRSFDSFEDLVADMRKRFKFLGDMGAYYMLYVVGEDVPPHEEWMKTHDGGSRSRRT